MTDISFFFDKMKAISFVLPVGDLLRNVGTQDRITLEKVMLDGLPDCEAGVSLVCEMNAVNEHTVYVRLCDIVTQMKANCDSCGISYIQDIVVPSYDLRFGVPQEIHKSKHKDLTEDEYDFPIDSKTETIDIAEAIYQAILMTKPIISHCSECKTEQEQDMVDEYDMYA